MRLGGGTAQVIVKSLIAALRERIAGRTANRCGVLVIGGAVVEISPRGHPFAKAGTVQYLDGLATIFDTVYFFAPAVIKEKEDLVYRSRLGDRVIFYPLTHVDRQGIKRLLSLLHDVRRICTVGSRAQAALEFFPSAGGVIGSLLLRVVSTRYGLYFGTDPFLSLKSIPTLTGRFRQLMKRLASRVASAIADFVLVRDPRQFQKLKSRLMSRAHLSAPISGLPRPIDIRLDRCQGEEIRLLYVGMFSQRKGILDLFQVVRLLTLDACRRYRLLLVGAPEMLGPDHYTITQLEEHCRALGIEHLVEFRGYLDDMAALQAVYELADIFVLASRREGFPRVVEEALLYGLPVIAFELASLAEVLRNSVQAMLITSGDPYEFARLVRRVAEDSALRNSLIASGSEFMQSRFPQPVSQQHAALLSNAK